MLHNNMKKLTLSALAIVSAFWARSVLAVNIANPSTSLFVGSLGDNSFKGIIMFVITNVLLPIVGVVSILFIIIGGFQYITSGGKEEQAESGKKTLTNAIIGLAIVIMSYIIVTVIINALKGSV